MSFKKKSFTTIGLMSGTSLDGIDATVVETNGIHLERYNIYDTYNYNNETKNLLKEAVTNPYKFIKSHDKMKKLNNLITIDHLDLINSLIEKSKVSPNLIGFHGQTILHNPRKRISIQCGNPSLLQKSTNINIISNFRKDDLLNGGQGAPLAPIYHKFILTDLNFKLPSCIINIGGIANVSYWDGVNLIGFDTGPGNVLIDKYTKKYLNKPYDENGELGLLGKSSKKLVNKFMKHDYFSFNFPKSLDNQDFNSIFDYIEKEDLNHIDKIATLSDFTATSISYSINNLPKKPKKIIIGGGGLFNKSIIKKLKDYFNIPIYTSYDVKLNGKMIEAELIAFIAARRMNNLETTFPLTTGCKNPTICGEIFLNNN